MQKLIGLIIGAVFLYVYYNSGFGIGGDFAVPQQAQARNSKKDIAQVEFMGLFEQDKTFQSLAINNHYTVIEVYLNTCSICKRLESGFKPFLNLRQDVLIRRVHFPEAGMNFSFSSPQEAEKIKTRIESYKVCGTPHIEIYGPDQELLAADDCRKKEGLAFLRRWISTETGILRSFL